jgi:hypothetical protein
MASSSKPPGRSSKQQKSRAGRTRVIAVKRTDVLPRKGNVSLDRRKPVMELPTEAASTTSALSSKKKDRRLQRPEQLSTRAKKTRAAGRATRKVNEPAPVKVMPLPEEVVPEGVEVLAALHARALEAPPEAEELMVEASAIVEETTIVEAAFALPVEAPDNPAPAPHQRKRILATVVSGLLSGLRRWTGSRQ